MAKMSVLAIFEIFEIFRNFHTKFSHEIFEEDFQQIFQKSQSEIRESLIVRFTWQTKFSIVKNEIVFDTKFEKWNTACAIFANKPINSTC